MGAAKGWQGDSCPPPSTRLRPLDLEFMRRLSKIVNVVPVIAKADTLTLEEREEFKQRVRGGTGGSWPSCPPAVVRQPLTPRVLQIQRDLKAHAISVYPQEDFDEDPDDRLLNDRIRVSVGRLAQGGAWGHPGVTLFPGSQRRRSHSPWWGRTRSTR